ncbi:MAG: RDD family protein [Bacilli bacterium]|nr:RDD family protein [Bacilli bacterium]
MVLRRIGAYIIDIIIVFMVVTVVGGFFPRDRELENDLSSRITEMIQIGSVSDEDLDEIASTTYEISKKEVGFSIISIIIFYLYFAVLPVYNNGKTLGKMVTKTRIKSSAGDNLSLWQTSVRGMFIYQYLFDLISVILIVILSKSAYLNITSPLSNIQSILLIVCLLSIIFNNGIGLHDVCGKTVVVLDAEDEEETNASKWKGKKSETTKKSTINSDRIKNHTKRKGE